MDLWYKLLAEIGGECIQRSLPKEAFNLLCQWPLKGSYLGLGVVVSTLDLV